MNSVAVMLWEVTPDFPAGRLRPMTDDEIAGWHAVQAAAGAAEAADDQADANAATMVDRVTQAITNLETAAQNWSTITPAQKDSALKLTVQVAARLARLLLHRLDTAT